TPAASRQAVAQIAGLAGPAERRQDPGARHLRPVRTERAGGARPLLLRPEPVAAAGADPQARSPRLVGAPAGEPVTAGAEPEREGADGAARPGAGGHGGRGAD